MPQRSQPREWADVAEAFGRRVTDLRLERELTQEQLASKAGISRNQVQNIEHSRNNSKDEAGRAGHGNPTMDTVFQLADALQVDVRYLLFGGAEGDSPGDTD